MTRVAGPIQVSGPEVLDRIGRFRFEVWAATGLLVSDAFPGKTWRDSQDDSARHWIIEVDGRLAGSVRYCQFDRLDDMPEAAQYRELGLALEGPIGLPERLVVHPAFHGMGLRRSLLTGVWAAAKASGARWLLSECAPTMVSHLLARGRKLVGPAALDPRFPTVRFQFILTDVEKL